MRGCKGHKSPTRTFCSTKIDQWSRDLREGVNLDRAMTERKGAETGRQAPGRRENGLGIGG